MEAGIELVEVAELVVTAAGWGCCSSTSDGLLDEMDTMAGSCQSMIGCIVGMLTGVTSVVVVVVACSGEAH